MIIDLHVHTSPRSPCSQIIPHALVAEAKRLGIDGLCLTEHHVLWDPSELADLARAGGIALFTANEITTDQGDILVFGYREPVPGVIPIRDLHREVAAAGGLMIAAHPLRGFKVFGIGSLQLTTEQAARRKVFQFVDGVEVLNGRLNDAENGMAAQVAERLDLIGTTGSDAHELTELGRAVMLFEREILSEADLITELRARRFTHGTVK
jgi:predicted metal-dependent phosphoesterase TrpH